MIGRKGAAAVLATLIITACAAQTKAEPAAPPAQAAVPAPAPPDRMTIAPTPIGPAPEPVLQWIGPTQCAGAFRQGGLMVCRTAINAIVSVNGRRAGDADGSGYVVIGFDRDFTGDAKVTIDPGEGGTAETITFPIAARVFDTQSITGLPPSTVNPPTDPAFQARLARERDLKNAGSASRAPISGFLTGFVWPVENARQSGAWGNQRILNGEPRPPHMGMDIAAPTGTPIRAPADGVVSLAEPDMHFDGGLVFIDHGQGVITQYLHMSRLDVKPGDTVRQGQVIGAVGAKGRATGPHLCWRMRVRGVQVDPGEALTGLSIARETLLAQSAPVAGVAPVGWRADR